MVGIALGVMVLITVLSVMNGFSKEMRSRMLSAAPHITVKSHFGDLNPWKPLFTSLQNRTGKRLPLTRHSSRP